MYLSSSSVAELQESKRQGAGRVFCFGVNDDSDKDDVLDQKEKMDGDSKGAAQ